MEFDERKAEEAVERLLEAIGEDPGRPGLKDTPRRVAAMYREIFSGLHQDPEDLLDVTFEEGHDEMVMVKDIPLTSMCEHHLVAFVGKAHVAYIPSKDGRITGLSKLARVVDLLSKRPQVQERLTAQIADAIEVALQPRGAQSHSGHRDPSQRHDVGRQDARCRCHDCLYQRASECFASSGCLSHEGRLLVSVYL